MNKALPEPRQGKKIKGAFRAFPTVSYLSTLGNPQEIVWSSLNNLAAPGIANPALEFNHGIIRKGKREAIIRNLSIYIEQAFKFYQSELQADSRTSPLFYYYSFLNLAKAVSEINNPNFHEKRENYRHGIDWRPNPSYYVNMWNEKVAVFPRRRGGVWHTLWEATMGRQFRAKKEVKFSVEALLCLCPEIGTEYTNCFKMENCLVSLSETTVQVDENKNEAWITFEVYPDELEIVGIFPDHFIRWISHYGEAYRQVMCKDSERLCFELKKPRPWDPNTDPYFALKRELKALNLFTTFSEGELEFYIAIQGKLKRRLPQIMILYTLIFWLGSLVRYDPHSVEELQKSEFWLIIDGFLYQSRVWLLELFEWYLYNEQIILKRAR
jgi:hypothetical protein